jgi:hypothetical protein
MKNIPQAYRPSYFWGFSNFYRYYTRSQAGKSTGTDPLWNPWLHTCTIWNCQKKHQDIHHHIIVLLHCYIPVQYEIVRRNTRISIIILLSFSIVTYLYNMKLSEETPRYPASYYCPTLIHTCTTWYCQKKH